MNEAKTLPLFLDLKEAAESLEEVAVDLIKSEGEEMTSHWYHSPLDVDLYFWLDSRKNIIKQQISIFGQICEWNILDGVRTGLVFENEKENSETHTTIEYDKSIQRTSLIQTLELLENVMSMPNLFKGRIIENYKSNPILDNLNPEEVLARYGDKSTYTKSRLANFIKKLFK